MSGIPGDAQLAVLKKIAPVLVDSDAVTGGQDAVDKALDTIIEPTFAEKAAG